MLLSQHHTVGLALLGLLDIAASAPSCTSGEWVVLTSIPTIARQEHAVVAVANTTIAIIGGVVPTSINTTDTTDLFQLYDIESDTWSTVSPAPMAVNHPNVAAIGNTVYLLGGVVDGPVVSGYPLNWVATGSSHAYDVASDTWTELAHMPNGTQRGGAAMGVYGEMIYLAGGMTVLETGYQDTINSVIAFNTTSGAWQRLAEGGAELSESRQHAPGVAIGGTWYVAGGRRYSQTNVRDTVFELDLTNATAGWQTSTGHMPVARGGLMGGAVGTKFYTFGGEGNVNTATGVFNQTEVFDTETQLWTELSPMAVPRHGCQGVAVGDRVYIPGGGLQQDGKVVTIDGVSTLRTPTDYFDAYCV
jgi:N-acetylneuraminic acid mutarotase